MSLSSPPSTSCPPWVSPQNDVVPGPGHAPSSLNSANSELLPAARLPRSPQPPSVPPRSPLRPRTTIALSDNDRRTHSVISPLRMHIVHTQSLPLLSTDKSIAVHATETIYVDEKSTRKSLLESLNMPPPSPVDTIDDGDSSTGSSSVLNNSVSSPPTMSKRTHALLELLSSERAYASDLTFIRDIHIPLALGGQPLHRN